MEGGGNDTKKGYRVRQCLITYYFSDSSICIDEPRTKNSGLPQGRFMRRLAVKRPQGGLFTPDDFEIGNEMEVSLTQSPLALRKTSILAMNQHPRNGYIPNGYIHYWN